VPRLRIPAVANGYLNWVTQRAIQLLQLLTLRRKTFIRGFELSPVSGVLGNKLKKVKVRANYCCK